MDLKALHAANYIVWLDETTVNCWATLLRRVWTDGESITMPMQAKRGTNRTIFGAIGAYYAEDDAQKLFQFFHMVARRTCAADTRDFIQQIIDEAPVAPDKIVICTDNHSAHHSKVVTKFAAAAGLRLKFLPAYSSTLNPGKRI
ncbi:MAG: transposase [Candidatus Thermoplasmatota archaeon]|nr:transposase [Candidatus Thermoplasmatota archaeon]